MTNEPDANEEVSASQVEPDSGAVAVAAAPLVPCPDCDAELETQQDLLVHQQRLCPGREAAPAAQKEPEKVALRPKLSFGRGSLALVEIPDNRPSFAWYFRPPNPRMDGIATTGLPIDCFYQADAWDPSHVDGRTRKSVVRFDGSTERVRLVNPIDKHNMMHRGVPIVAMWPPDHDIESQANWERICELLEEVRDWELEIERGLLDDKETEMNAGGVTGAARTALVAAQRVLQARISVLEKEHDFAALFRFFVAEAIRSQETLQSPEARMNDLIDDRVKLHMEAVERG